jgi:hypothetical protein
MKFIPRIAAIALVSMTAFSFAPVKAMAADVALTEALIKQFMATMPDIQAFSTGMEKSGKGAALEEAFKANAANAGSNLTPYSAGIASLKEKFPADYAQLAGIVGKHGFSSAESWADTGNEVIKSYMALKMENMGPAATAMMQNMSPDMLAKLPPEARAQVEKSKKMMDEAAAVPAAEKEAMRPHMSEFENWAQKAAAERKTAAGTKAPAAAPDAAGTKAAIQGMLNNMMQKQTR